MTVHERMSIKKSGKHTVMCKLADGNVGNERSMTILTLLDLRSSLYLVLENDMHLQAQRDNKWSWPNKREGEREGNVE